MTVKLEFAENNLVISHTSGVLTYDEFNEAKKEVADFIKKNGKINMLVIIEEGFSNIKSFASWHDDDIDEFIQKNTNRLAIVGNLKWYEDALLFFLHGLVPFTIEYFKIGQEELAIAWLLQ
jgi:hypothetical protein